jgi:hypothetical protein
MSEHRGADFLASDANRLLEDPVLKDSFKHYEEALINRAVFSQDDAEKCRLLDAVHVCRMVKQHLLTTIFDGKRAVKAADEIASGENRWL